MSSDNGQPHACEGVSVLIVYRCACGRVWSAPPPTPPLGLLSDVPSDDPRLWDIGRLNLSTRAFNCLTEHGRILSVADLLRHPCSDLLKIKNLGRVTLREIVTELAAYELTLPRAAAPWRPPKWGEP